MIFRPKLPFFSSFSPGEFRIDNSSPPRNGRHGPGDCRGMATNSKKTAFLKIMSHNHWKWQKAQPFFAFWTLNHQPKFSGLVGGKNRHFPSTVTLWPEKKSHQRYLRISRASQLGFQKHGVGRLDFFLKNQFFWGDVIEEFELKGSVICSALL